MNKERLSPKELKKIQLFLKNKKITLRMVSESMRYSSVHVIKVFNSKSPATPRFTYTLVEAVEKLLSKDLRKFQEMVKEK